MGRHLKLAVTVSAAVAVLAAGSALYAADPQNESESMMGGGMMQHGHGMIGMMGEMSRMMGHCSAMMGGGNGRRPNDQWRKPAPEDNG
jgi:hypothetical protein